MIDNLHTKLTAVLRGAGIPVALSEDEVTQYPYVTFELPTEYRYTKDGPYKVVGNLTIRSVSDDFDEADGLRVDIHTAIAGGFGGLTPVPPSEEDEQDVALEEPATEIEPTPIVEHVTSGTSGSETEESVGDVESGEGDEVGTGDVPVEQAGEASGAQDEDPCTYTARLTDVRKDCMDGIWVIEQDFILNQYEQ